MIRNRFPLAILFCSLLLLMALPCQTSFGARQEVSARYSQPRGTNISWHIKIPSPPPAAVIVIQSIPTGTVIKESSPAYSSYDPTTGTAKWLLTNVLPGQINMTMELDTPIRKKGEIHGKIIFQDQSSQAIAEGFITLRTKKKATKAIEGC